MYHFIVNPKSSSGKGLKIWGGIAHRLASENVAYDVFFTEERGHATRIARQISSAASSDTIVAVGGDGTANEVINGLCHYSSLLFGYIPTGSANDLARGLALPSSPSSALDAILHPSRVRHIRIGNCAFNDTNRKFIVSAGLGFDAAVCHEAMHSRLKQTLNQYGLGKLTYLGIALKQLVLAHPAPMTITLDEQPPVSYDCGNLFVAAMNLKYEGGGFMFCPDADGTDDFIDLCVINKMPLPKILRILPTAFSGRHVGYEGVHILRGKKAVITAQRPLPVHTDGEPWNFHSSVTVTLEEEKLPFIIG